jgi:5-methylcytosine-specific restriction endonuclease McrA
MMDEPTPEEESARKWELWQSAPHQYGAARIHMLAFEEPGNTLCGKRLSEIGGKQVPSDREATCKSCEMVRVRRIERARSWQEFGTRSAEQQAQAEAEREQKRAEWFRRYNAYLKTPQWRTKSQMVLERASYRCEGCGMARATQAHHLTYDHVGDELLWELRAVCKGCHERAHAGKRELP